MALPLQEISDRLEIEEVLVATATLSTIEIGTRTPDAVIDDTVTGGVMSGVEWHRLVRLPDGWKIKELVEEGHWNHNVPPGFRF